MTELITTDNLTKLPVGLQKFAQARIGNKAFKLLESSVQKKQCLDIVTLAHAAIGNKGTEADILVFQTNELISCLTGKYAELTIPEIKEAFEMLLSGEFGQFMGMNKRTYYIALKGYYELPQRTEGMKQYLALIEAPKVSEKPLHVKVQETKESVIRAFEEYKETKKLPYTSFAYYDFLKEQGKFNWTKEEKLEMHEQATREYEGLLRERKEQRVIKSSQVAELMLSLSSNPTFKNLCKKIALKRYFNLLINEGKELEI